MAETKTRSKPRAKPKPKAKPRNHLLKERADGFGPASRGSEVRRFHGPRYASASCAGHDAQFWVV